MNPAIYFFSTINQSAPYTPTELPLLNGQIWDAKNLNTYRYRNGDVITNKITGWVSTTQGGWRYYNDNPINGSIYGKMYNWYAVSDSRNIAPVGWRVATNDDWSALSNFLSGDTNSGGALKATGTTLWTSPNTSATNSVGFTALPGGYKLGGNSTGFDLIHNYGYWWTFDSGLNVRMDYNTNNLVRQSGISLNRGAYVRLIKEDVTISGFTTLSATNINALSFNGGGEFTNLPYTPDVYDKGITWSILSNPNILANSYISVGSGTTNNPYDIPVSGLSANTTYYIRAYAKISGGTVTAYAHQISATTLTGLASLTTSAATDISYTTATCGGNITNDAGYPITSRGVCWSTIPNPTIELPTKTINGSGSGEFTSNLIDLNAGSTYYVRAYATNAATTAYGNEISFSTIPAVETNLIFSAYSSYHAHSLRKLSDTYYGYCLMVRRTNTTPNTLTTTVNVEFDNNGTISLNSRIHPILNGGSTSATTLGEFAAATISGYTNIDGVNENQNINVVTWYDQGGNNKDITQITNSRQPNIVTGGSLETSGGKVALKFQRANGDYLTYTDTTIPINNITSYVVGSSVLTTSANFFQLGYTPVGSGADNRFYINSYTGYISYDTLNTFNTSTLITPNVPRLFVLAADNNVAKAYSNSTQIAPLIGIASVIKNSDYVRVGVTGGAVAAGHTNYMDGHVHEVISFIGLPNKTPIDNNINTYYNLWT